MSVYWSVILIIYYLVVEPPNPTICNRQTENRIFATSFGVKIKNTYLTPRPVEILATLKEHITTLIVDLLKNTDINSKQQRVRKNYSIEIEFGTTKKIRTPTCVAFKTVVTFQYTGWLRGIHIIAYYHNPHISG